MVIMYILISARNRLENANKEIKNLRKNAVPYQIFCIEEHII